MTLLSPYGFENVFSFNGTFSNNDSGQDLTGLLRVRTTLQIWMGKVDNNGRSTLGVFQVGDVLRMHRYNRYDGDDFTITSVDEGFSATGIRLNGSFAGSSIADAFNSPMVVQRLPNGDTSGAFSGWVSTTKDNASLIGSIYRKADASFAADLPDFTFGSTLDQFDDDYTSVMTSTPRNVAVYVAARDRANVHVAEGAFFETDGGGRPVLRAPNGWAPNTPWDEDSAAKAWVVDFDSSGPVPPKAADYLGVDRIYHYVGSTSNPGSTTQFRISEGALNFRVGKQSSGDGFDIGPELIPGRFIYWITQGLSGTAVHGIVEIGSVDESVNYWVVTPTVANGWPGIGDGYEVVLLVYDSIDDMPFTWISSSSLTGAGRITFDSYPDVVVDNKELTGRDVGADLIAAGEAEGVFLFWGNRIGGSDIGRDPSVYEGLGWAAPVDIDGLFRFSTTLSFAEGRPPLASNIHWTFVFGGGGLRNLYLGDQQVEALYLGDTPVDRVYLGSDLVWE